MIEKNKPHLSLAWVLLPWSLILFLVRRILDPHWAVVARDIGAFHLPLRAAFQTLWRQQGAFPEWNPLLHGGQPILSNPNYAAFYPPTWLGLLFEPVTGMQILYVLHLLGLALGTFVLLRHLEARPSVATLGAMSCSAGFGLYLVSSFNLLCGFAWLPWVGWFTLRSLDARGRSRFRNLGLSSLCLALQLLAGEPVACLLSGTLVGALWVLSPRKRSYLLVIPLLAGCLGAVQLLPTLDRLQDTPLRAEMSTESALSFSTPPERLGEFLWPHLWGEANRHEEGLFFGWGLQSHDTPYVLSLYSGWILLIFALGLGFRKTTPHRGLWLLLGAAGLFVALGRHNPLLGPIVGWLPGLTVVRYPEKFILVTCFSISMVGALGWEAFLRRPSHRASYILAGWGALATLVPLGVWVIQYPEFTGLQSLVREHSGLPPTAALVQTGVSYLSRELLVAAALGALGVLFFSYLSRRGAKGRSIEWAAILLLGLDLTYYGGSAFLTWSKEEYRRPPTTLVSLEPGDRVVPPPGEYGSGLGLMAGEVGLIRYRDEKSAVFPYTGICWGYGYLFHPDYDYMATGWAVHAQRLHDAFSPENRLRLYGLWNAKGRVEKIPPTKRLALWLMTAQPPPSGVFRALDETAMRFRSPAGVEEFASLPEAVFALSRDRRPLGTEAFLWTGNSVARRAEVPRKILKVEDLGDRIRIVSSGERSGWIVSAITYHSNWEAEVEGKPIPVHPTAAGQMAVRIPAGKHQLILRYRDSWVRVGALITAFSLLVGGLGAIKLRASESQG